MWILFILLSAASWGLVNVLDSLLVRHYEKNPLVLMFSQGVFSVLILAVLSLLLPTASAWWLPLLAVGMFSFLGDLYFFYVLERLDVSVVNGAWAMQSIYVSIAAFLFYHEHWNTPQTLGAVLIIASVLLLSFWHQHVSWSRTLGMLGLLGALYSPNLLVQKAAIVAGQPLLAVFFWSLVGRECCSLTLPWFFPVVRRRIAHLARIADGMFILLSFLVIFFFFGAVMLWIHAYSTGPLSLTAVVANVQPFFVLLVAWLFVRLAPRYAPRELLTRQSVRVKVVSFCIAFIGLALLSVS